MINGASLVFSVVRDLFVYRSIFSDCNMVYLIYYASSSTPILVHMIVLILLLLLLYISIHIFFLLVKFTFTFEASLKNKTG